MTVTRRTFVALPPLLAAAATVAAAPPAAPAGPVRLIANENPYGPGAKALAAIQAALPEAWQYPVGKDATLRRQIADREGVAPDQVMLGDGSGELLRIAALAWTGPGKGVVAARPTFTFLQEYARLLGAPVTEVPLDSNLRHDLPALEAAVRPETGLLYLCNPNNPTGTLVSGAELRPFVSRASQRVPVVVDEAYLDLWDDAAEHSCIDRVRAGEQVVVTRTFSKLHALAGLRIGYAIGPAAVLKRFESLRMSILNAVGLAAATASHADLAYQVEARRRLKAALTLTERALDDVGWRRTATRGNFVFFDTGRPVAEFSAAMRQAGFLVGRPFPPLDTWCRVSMGTVPQMERFAAALRSYAAKAAA
jgi:histidinol-phosphate aminotransferase